MKFKTKKGAKAGQGIGKGLSVLGGVADLVAINSKNKEAKEIAGAIGGAAKMGADPMLNSEVKEEETKESIGGDNIGDNPVGVKDDNPVGGKVVESNFKKPNIKNRYNNFNLDGSSSDVSHKPFYLNNDNNDKIISDGGKGKSYSSLPITGVLEEKKTHSSLPAPVVVDDVPPLLARPRAMNSNNSIIEDSNETILKPKRTTIGRWDNVRGFRKGFNNKTNTGMPGAGKDGGKPKGQTLRYGSKAYFENAKKVNSKSKKELSSESVKNKAIGTTGKYNKSADQKRLENISRTNEGYNNASKTGKGNLNEGTKKRRAGQKMKFKAKK